MSEVSIADELAQAAGFRPTKERRQTYLRNLVKKLDLIPDAAWQALSDPAQKWVKDAMAAHDLKVPIPELPGYEPPTNGQVETAIDPKAKTRGEIVYKIKAAIIDDPTASAAEIFERVSKDGVVTTLGTVQTLRADCRGTLKVLVDTHKLTMEL